MVYVDWSIEGPKIVNCNCDFGCPCQFNALPSRGGCRTMSAMRIDKGHFGALDLSGLSWCSLFAWPKAIHEGDGEAFIVISDHASPGQRDALLTILSGGETEPGATIFNVFASTVARTHEPRFAPIEFALDIDRRRGRVRVPGVVRTTIEPIFNPVTGKEHRVRLTLADGFEFHEAEFASGDTEASGPIDLSLAKGHAHLAMMRLGPYGVARTNEIDGKSALQRWALTRRRSKWLSRASGAFRATISRIAIATSPARASFRRSRR